ncbi:MAG: methylmalonyl-CoA epimerase [Actinomycetota bacterium]|nr:methylmalonyl-CoA epimerase [Actinomycetota bacterium]MED5292896.1 methylmalonyl-CoA epimerase [Actinomycetota bacterium]|tara:strand:+ start:14238 stop:14642 length:405 start_codon:yes stop_codon:yes gene_type:complete
MMILTEIDHVAIAVHDLEAAIAYYEEAFGAEVHHREIVESDGVEEALVKVADSYIQLTTATRPDSPIAKYLEKRGEGLHHIGYRVDDCQAALEAMVAAGATPIDQSPRPGSRGTTVAFMHPKGSFGTLIELVQE